jgi:hypothetical protein
MISTALHSNDGLLCTDGIILYFLYPTVILSLPLSSVINDGGNDEK